jgi:deoxyribodipyrimidine photo-lyase
MPITNYQKARAVLESIDPAAYANNRNYDDGGTRLSVYITRGVITLPEIRDYLLGKYGENSCYKLLFELAWREYWQHEWQLRGDDIFSSIKNPQQGTISTRLPSAVTCATTTISAIDKGISQLISTGYISNHMRMWIAGLVCNIAHTDWWEPSRWMYYHLLDGDPASNMLSWQWVAGTFSSKTYLPAQSNIDMYTSTRQPGTYLDHDYDQLAAMDVPNALIDRSELDLYWEAPNVTVLDIDTAKPTLLYHPFWLNSNWRADSVSNRILILDTDWFERFPVSANVTQSMLDLASDIPGLQIYVGRYSELLPLLGSEIYATDHPYTRLWNASKDQMPKMYPNVAKKQYNSFMSYWKQCQKQ